MTPEQQKVYNGQTVLVTGHTGFKGSWLTLWLHKLGARVCGYALKPPTRPNNFEISRVRPLLERHFDDDIRNFSAVKRAIDMVQPEIIFHLAAQALVQAGYRLPKDTFDTNIGGTINLLEAVRQAARPCIVIVVTSDKVYQNREQLHGYRETDRLGGTDPYSASKSATELITSAYRQAYFPPAVLDQHGIGIATARAGNVIGGGDWAEDRIAVDIVNALSEQKEVLLRNPQAVRPWQHVLEPLDGYLTLAAQMKTDPAAHWADAWNFGPDPMVRTTVEQFTQKFIAAWGAGSFTPSTNPPAFSETAELRLSIEKAVLQLGWQPRLDLDRSIKMTVNWYKQYLASTSAPMTDHCLQDIATYSQPGNQGDEND